MEPTLTDTLVKVLVPLVVPALIGGLKTVYPKLKAHVPSLLWPAAVFGLARLGTTLCGLVSVNCVGNPFNWDPATVQAMVAAFIAIGVREAVKSARTGELQNAVSKLASALTPAAK